MVSILLSCTNSSDGRYTRYKTFPVEKNLKARVVSLDTVLFRYPYRVSVKDSIAIVMDLHNPDHYLHAFTYPEWKHVVSFGKRGEAPEEMLLTVNIQFDSLDSLWALDANKMEITRWKITPSTGSAERVEEIKLDKKLVRSLDFHTMESSFLVPDYMGEYRFRTVDHTGKPMKSTGVIPSEQANSNTSRPALAQAWRSFMDYNPHNGILAMATQLGEVLEIYNLKEDTQVVLYGPEGEPQFKTSSGEGIPTGIMGFSDVKVTDKYIYTVFQGIRFKDKFAAYKQGKVPEDGGRYIYVFDLKGNPVRKYILDHLIHGIDVNEETHTIVATQVKSDDPLVEFEI